MRTVRCATCALLFTAIVFCPLDADQQPGTAPGPAAAQYSSRIMIYDLGTKASTLVHEADAVWEAPNWSRDGRFLLSNSGGRLYRVPVDRSSAPEAIDLDPSLRCNNDHDFSPDGRQIAISASSPSSRQSQVYVVDADGSNLRLVVSGAPSYFHGWSPDGKYLSFVANRDGTQYDIYRAPSAGGQEERLTADPAYDDGTDYSRDGKWIYFNSNRGGGWNIWRIPPEGAGPDDQKAQRVTNDDFEDWFPHPSPDGKSLLFLSFPHGTEGHNDRNARVQLRMVPMPDQSIDPVTPRTLVEFTGGQGTINVNSWAPDSTRFAYVSYAAKIGPEHRLLGLLRERDAVAGSVLAAHGLRLAEVREIANQPGAHPDAWRETLSGDEMKRVLRHAGARWPSGGNEARELTDRILKALVALKRPPGE